MVVTRATSFTVQDITSLAVRCAACGLALTVPLPERDDRAAAALRGTVTCPCGAVLLSSDHPQDPDRLLLLALLGARRGRSAAVEIRIAEPAGS